jgi:hypothetical protein
MIAAGLVCEVGCNLFLQEGVFYGNFALFPYN